MWRVVLMASLLLTLALGTGADAKCRVCVSSVRADKADSGTTLLFEVQAIDGATLPETASAVVMQVDGNRSKCLNVPVSKTGVSGGIASYRGALPAYYGSASSTIASYSGRVDFAGDIFEFTVPLDGKPGTSQLVTAAAATEFAAQSAAQASAPTAAPTTAPSAAPVEAQTVRDVAVAGWSGLDPLRQLMAVLGAAVVVATIVGAYVDRKRALARVSAG